MINKFFIKMKRSFTVNSFIAKCGKSGTKRFGKFIGRSVEGIINKPDLNPDPYPEKTGL